MRQTFLWTFLLAVCSADNLSQPTTINNNNNNNNNNNSSSSIDITTAVLPSQDDFYNVPHNISNLPPGTMLRSRKAPSPLAVSDTNYAAETYQLLYTTTDEDNSNTATVATLLIPRNANRSTLISFQTAVHTVTIDCAPSFSFLNASRAYPSLDSPTSQVQLLFVQVALSRGFNVVVPDFGGPNATILKDKLPEHAVLDSLRAALDSGLVDENATAALWGYSGGGTITFRAVQAQPEYAPELRLAGAAIGGAPIYMNPLDRQRALMVNKSPYAAFIPILIHMYAAIRPEFLAVVNDMLKPEYREKFDLPLHQCTDGNFNSFSNLDVLSWFRDTSFLDITPTPDESTKLKIPSDIPIYWYHATADLLADFHDTSRRLEGFCSDGASITQLINTGHDLSHTSFAIVGAFGALRWLADRFAGVVPDKGCSKKTTESMELDGEFLALFTDDVRRNLASTLYKGKMDLLAARRALSLLE
ncbi:Secretory lipase family protein [Ophiocordyceps camponoti-floridani]|uniref:Secretory lipase family protein n=1 Tax=Ophiocordyceps camponoti-floridani TaxID=2030778 RepID=A0A8H4VCM6_9HYPO|nr:Secretory lipase family protein [Ophiocordyceps camponoti-floridani]